MHTGNGKHLLPFLDSRSVTFEQIEQVLTPHSLQVGCIVVSSQALRATQLPSPNQSLRSPSKFQFQSRAPPSSPLTLPRCRHLIVTVVYLLVQTQQQRPFSTYANNLNMPYSHQRNSGWRTTSRTEGTKTMLQRLPQLS